MMRSKHLTLFCLATVLGLSSCEQLGPRTGGKVPMDLVQPSEPPPEEASNLPLLEESQTTIPLTAPEFRPGNGKLFNPPTPLPEPKTPGKYTLNFDDADLGEVVKVILGDILQHNYVLSPKAGGKITLQTTRPLHRGEVLPAFEMVLRMNGLALVKKKGFYWIGPVSDATPEAPLSAMGAKAPPGYQIRIFPLHYVGVESMEKILKSITSPHALLYSDPARNLIVIAGTPGELANIEQTIEAFDVNYLKGMSLGLFPLNNLDPETLAEDLKQALGEKIMGSDNSLIRLMPIKRLNALMVITSQPDYLKLAQNWITRLDRAIIENSGTVHVYRAQNVDAVKLAETLNEVFTGLRPSAAVSLAPGLKKATVSSKGKKSPGRLTRFTNKDKKDIRIIADEPNNALVIIADQEDYRAVERVLKQLDKLPLQVLIDASIIEVTLTDNLQYGLEWFAQNKIPSKFSTTGFSSNGLDLGNAAKTALLNSLAPGFSYVWQSKSQDIGVILKAAADNGKVNVISSPSLMVLNNHEATIVVGDQISLQTSSSTNTSGGSNPLVTSTFEQRDTGVQLKIKPRVNSGGLVIMELEQKVDDVGPTRQGSPNPDISQRQINSTVAVKNGDTLVLGGLIKDNRNQSHDGIPFLYKIPLIGWMFGTSNQKFRRTELVVLITPRVVKSRRDAYAITNEFKQRLRELYQAPEQYLIKPNAGKNATPTPNPVEQPALNPPS